MLLRGLLIGFGGLPINDGLTAQIDDCGHGIEVAIPI